MNKQLRVFKVSDEAKLPSLATSGSAGYDLYTTHSGYVDARSREIVSTGVVVDIPKGCCGQIWPRSGFSVRSGIETGAGIIDYDYPGEIKVVLHNHGKSRFTYKKHTRIAQLLIIPVITPHVVECDHNMKTINERTGGFGSTGKY